MDIKLDYSDISFKNDGRLKLLIIVGSYYWSLGILFVYRNAVQGLGYGVPAMAAGVFELIARALIGIFAVPVFGFDAACYAGPLAWIAADLLLIPVFYIVIHILKKRYPTPSLPEKLSALPTPESV